MGELEASWLWGWPLPELMEQTEGSDSRARRGPRGESASLGSPGGCPGGQLRGGQAHSAEGSRRHPCVSRECALESGQLEARPSFFSREIQVGGPSWPGVPPPGAHETFVRKSPLWELPGQQGHRPGMPFLRLRQPALLSQAWTAGATEGGGEGGDGAWRQA